MSGKLSRYRRLAPHLMQHSQRRALPDSNRTDLSREAFAWLSIVLALRLALASSSVSSDMVTSSPSACNLRWRHRVRPNAERRCNGSPGSRLNQLVRRLSRLNLGTISLAQSSVDSNVALHTGRVLPDDLPRNVAFCEGFRMPAHDERAT
jgi:hypothetical protein